MRRSTEARDHRLHHRMVDAQHREAVERDVVDEVLVGAVHRLDRAVMVEMLRVHVGDDGDDRRQLHEGAVGFVRLHHHPVAGAEPRIGAVIVDDAAVDDGRVEARRRRSAPPTIEVVVVLPWVPPTATDHLRRISSASISARRTTGSSLARAATTSGLSGFTAEETTTTSASAEVLGAMADLDRDPELAQPLGDVATR